MLCWPRSTQQNILELCVYSLTVYVLLISLQGSTPLLGQAFCCPENSWTFSERMETSQAPFFLVLSNIGLSWLTWFFSLLRDYFRTLCFLECLFLDFVCVCVGSALLFKAPLKDISFSLEHVSGPPSGSYYPLFNFLYFALLFSFNVVKKYSGRSCAMFSAWDFFACP